MSDSVEGLIDVPREFVKEGVQFMNKCQKRRFSALKRNPIVSILERRLHPWGREKSKDRKWDANEMTADRKEFIKISQAIAMGFVAMGTVGFVVKLSMSTHLVFHIKIRIMPRRRESKRKRQIDTDSSPYSHQQHPRRRCLSESTLRLRKRKGSDKLRVKTMMKNHALEAKASSQIWHSAANRLLDEWLSTCERTPSNGGGWRRNKKTTYPGTRCYTIMGKQFKTPSAAWLSFLPGQAILPIYSATLMSRL
jgi:protein transport protein SEC61 subunit gamma-like protein